MPAQAVFPSMITPLDDGLVQYTARAHFFEAGTTTPKVVYTSSTLDTPHPSPLPVNGNGRFPQVWVGVGSYRVQIKVDAGTILEDYDNLQGATPDIPDIPAVPTQGTVIPTGFELVSESDTLVAGWVRANGRSIGNAGSGASELASTACEALFIQRWNKVPALDIGGGRGVSAMADWLAGKTVPLPDARGRAIVGRDGMGNASAGRLTATSIATPDQAGAGFGVESVTLSEAQIPAHDHDITLASAGAHDHDGSTTDLQGAHRHQYGFDIYQAEFATSGFGPGRQTSSQVLQYTDEGGQHGHNLQMTEDGAHVHTADIADAGGGQPHSNVQPSRLVTVFIKL